MMSQYNFVFVSFQNYDGDIGLEKDEQSTVNDILSGRPLSVKVRFSLNFPVPKLKAIYYNDQLICSESPGLSFTKDISFFFN